MVKVEQSDDDGTSVGYVLIEGDHYLLKLERTEGDEPGHLEFSDFDEEFDVTAPADDEVIDLSTRPVAARCAASAVSDAHEGSGVRRQPDHAIGNVDTRLGLEEEVDLADLGGHRLVAEVHQRPAATRARRVKKRAASSTVQATCANDGSVSSGRSRRSRASWR